jgi:hypothetical protein
METKEEEEEKKENKNNNISKLLILYDELQFSFEVAKSKIESIFSAIESHNDKNSKNPRNFYHKKNNSSIHLENKYYTCEIFYEINSFSKIDSIDLSKYEGILLLFEETSIKNKIFLEKSHHFKDEYNFSSCIIIFEEEQEDLQNLDLFDQFIGQTIDKHFEVIYDCQNLKNFNEDDGIGAFNLSLHSSQWKGSKSVKDKEKEKEKKELVKEKKDENKFYQELKDNEEIEKVFGKIKEIKKLNMDPNISLEERRNNAEKAVMMLVNMLNLEDEDDIDEEEEKEINEVKDKKSEGK